MFAAHCFFRQGSPYNGHRNQPAPPFAAVVMLLDELEATLRAAGMVPVAVQCQSWPVPPRPDGNTVMAQIAIEAAPGEPRAPLRQWFQWQHAQWQWARAPIPTFEASLPLAAPLLPYPNRQAERSEGAT